MHKTLKTRTQAIFKTNNNIHRTCQQHEHEVAWQGHGQALQWLCKAHFAQVRNKLLFCGINMQTLQAKLANCPN